MALRTHFNQTKIGCPGIAEFTVQRTKALFDCCHWKRKSSKPVQKNSSHGLPGRCTRVRVGKIFTQVWATFIFFHEVFYYGLHKNKKMKDWSAKNYLSLEEETLKNMSDI